MANPRCPGLQNHLTVEEEVLLAQFYRGEVQFNFTDLLLPIKSTKATHNNLSPLHKEAGESEYQTYPANSDTTIYITPCTSPTNSILPSPQTSTHIFPMSNPISLTMSTPTPLPVHNECSAPKFDLDFEEQLLIFFGEFKAAAKAAAIHNNPEKMKKEVLRYVDAKTMRFWRSLLTFKDNTKSWDEFKTEVLENYPDALQQTDATTVDLDKVIETYRKSGISNSKELGKCHQEFSVVSDSLVENGIISSVQAANSYVSVFLESIRSRLDTHLQVQFPNKKKGEAYTLTQLKSSVDYLLSDASIPTSMANFSIGDCSSVPVSAITALVPIKSEPSDTPLPLQEEVSSLKQMVQQLIKERRSKLDKTRTCSWNGCTSRSLQDCPDLKEWVAKGWIEQNTHGYIKLVGEKDLPKEEHYQKGTVKEQFEKYFKDHPAAKTWILDIPSAPEPTLQRELAGINLSQHTPYTLRGYQGPAMLSRAVTFVLQGTDEEAAVNKLILKMETCRSAKELRTSMSSSQLLSVPSKSGNHLSKEDPEPEASNRQITK
ncbi:hypothetical protein GYMLUDRAFT_247580 [Collybiopsis luxurians FD-317 M1]|uniref:Retrotransposon gag domain-containing protein n=1 Tax=Collybiopsis luxurians FD-317 M1 TaxID=944289 RepID=A0A0D0BP10_9AGAR|nr:hypothetical protein GYMLUDRAFT_247580 [Collybiopsis luxurians FD-317 M1]